MNIQRYHPTICVLHWLLAAMIMAALIMSTFVMASIPDTDPAKISAILRHMSVGVLILVCTGLRLFTRKKTGRPATLPSGMPWADWLAGIVHRLLDMLVLVMIGSGIGMAIFSNLPKAILEGKSELLANLDSLPWHTLHVAAARVLFGVLLLHVGGALYHQFILRDGLVTRMWFGPWRRSRG